MKKIRIVFWLLVLGLAGLAVYQNLAFLLKPYPIKFDIGLVAYHTSDLPVAVYLLAFFFAGVLISLFFSLSHRYRARKTIRNLTDEVNAERKRVSELETELRSSGVHSNPASTAPVNPGDA
jgi:hypothetical protein